MGFDDRSTIYHTKKACDTKHPELSSSYKIDKLFIMGEFRVREVFHRYKKSIGFNINVNFFYQD